MIEKFNGIIYLAVFIIHFIGYAVYAYKCVFATKSFLDQYGVDSSAAIMTRFFGSFFIGAIFVGYPYRVLAGFVSFYLLTGIWNHLKNLGNVESKNQES